MINNFVLVRVLKVWQYLWPEEFFTLYDHELLKYLGGQSKLNMLNWLDSYCSKYKNGEENVVVGAFSCKRSCT